MSTQEADVKSTDETEINQEDGKKNAPKKLTALERTAAEGEALLKEMGYKEEGEDQGRRRTRSGGRGIPASSPPAKKEKKTPATPGTGRRGRPKKVTNDTSKDVEEPEKKEEEVAESQKAEESTETEAKTEPAVEKETENHTEEKNSKTPAETKTSDE